ncbi:LPXTG cell wall anchor domain-containing protein [Kitasatospora sp. NPDC096147]|uniref:DUF7507 domain-containing protein n=1 Tax=Kitasatospora sp. NPDC096147 TaxID=3364093 RepID=UPI00380A7AAF
MSPDGSSVLPLCHPSYCWPSKPGDTITYSVLVTDTGSVTLRDIVPGEGEFTGAGPMGPVSCPEQRPLLPGQRTTCTAKYTVRAADLTGRPLRNTATAGGRTPDGASTLSPPATATVDSVAPAAPLPLPHTGSDGVWLEAGLALGLVAVGGSALLIARRRRREP